MSIAKYRPPRHVSDPLSACNAPGSQKFTRAYAISAALVMTVLGGITWTQSPSLHNPGAVLLLLMSVGMLSRIFMLICHYLPRQTTALNPDIDSTP